MDTVTLVGLVVLVLERCVSDEGRPSAGDSSIMGGGTRFVSGFAFCEGVWTIGCVERVGEGIEDTRGEWGGEGAWIDA